VTRSTFLIALLLIAANLRPSLTGVGPLLKTLQEDLQLSAAAVGLLNSLPLLIFAAFAPLAGVARRLGIERTMLAGLLLLIAGILIRSEGHAATLYVGMFVLATGVAAINVLLPALIKQHFPERVPAMTTAYATVMGGFAALASGLAVPMANVLPGGWQTSLASWALPAAIAMLVWLPHTKTSSRPARDEQPAARPQLWRVPLAWQVTGFMGMQSTLFYVSVSWFPAMLKDEGFTSVAAGWLLTVFQVAALLAGLAMPRLIRQYRDQTRLALGTSSLAMIGTLGLLFAPKAAALWMGVLGCGAGPSLILALSFMGLRAQSQQSAAALSLMAQSLGYLVAAAGPVVFGLLHDSTHGWTVPLLGVVAITLIQGACGLGAGRAKKI
jgi:CP family cyanate transporter-like MFS transporter